MMALRDEILANIECIVDAVKEGQDCETFLILEKDKPTDIASKKEFRLWKYAFDHVADLDAVVLELNRACEESV